MKRSIAFLTAFMLCAAMLMGCGGGEADVAGKTTPLDEQAEPEAPKSELTPTTEPTAEPELGDHKLSLGRMEGGVYENSYAGFGCKLDTGWTFYSAEELQELPDEVKEMLEGSEVFDEVVNLTSFFDMQAENAEMLASMNVVLVKMSPRDRLACSMLSEEDIADAMLLQSDKLIAGYAQEGITNVTALEKVDVNFLGETHKALYTEGELAGVKMYMLQLFDYTRGQYNVTLTVSSWVEDSTQEVLDLFFKVE